MDGYWIVRTYEAGNVGEKTKFFVPGARPTRSQRRLRDAARKQAQNEYSAEKALARLLNANFTEGDLLVGLDYSDDGLARLEAWALRQGLPMETEEERLDTMRAAAEHELQLMIRRVKRELDKLGLPLRYVAVTSDMDGDTGETVRVHHHLVVDRRCGTCSWKSGRAWAAWTGSRSPRRWTTRPCLLPDPAGAAGAGSQEVHLQPESAPGGAEGPDRHERGGGARAEGRRATVSGGVPPRPVPVHSVHPAGEPQKGSRRSPSGAGPAGKRTSAQAPNRGAEVPLGCKEAGGVLPARGMRHP